MSRDGVRPFIGPLIGPALLAALLLFPSTGHAGAVNRRTAEPAPEEPPKVVLIGMGDSLTHGTMDAANNYINTLNAYLQRIAESLGQVSSLEFSQPLFDEGEERISPLEIPTNLGVDGADSFTVVGVEYYKRVGAPESYVDSKYLCDKLLPRNLDDKYDKVLYPINIRARSGVSQVDAAAWLINDRVRADNNTRAVVVFWIGNNDSSTAALGEGGANPSFIPIPADLITQELTPGLRLLLRVAQNKGLVSFDSYTQATVDRNLTDPIDFANQYEHLVQVLRSNVNVPERVDIFLLTLPYYSAVGYLMDSEDLEFYLQKAAPSYSVPPTFLRVAPAGELITDPLAGDRVSLLTFGMMYALLSTGYTVEYTNQVLEVDGQQRDGLVLSPGEQQTIMDRIDGFNEVIKTVAAGHGPNVHVVDVAQYLNDGLTGQTEITIGERTLSRKWTRGNSFTLDGVHPAYAAQALIANFVISHINAALGLNAPLHDLESILATDPYIDNDGDGWAAGPDYATSGISELLFLLTDPDDTDPAVQVELPPDVWTKISRAMLDDLLGRPALATEAARLGIE